MWYNIQQEFPLLQNNPDLIYLDNASTTQKPASVIQAMSEYQETNYANIHRWVYDLAEQSEILYTDSKKKVASFVWWDYREIVYTYNATYASNILAQSLVSTYQIQRWDTVMVGLQDHHATIVPRQLLAQQFWFQVIFIPLDRETYDIDRVVYEELLQKHHIKVVCCSHVSNVTGKVYDVSRIGVVARQYHKDVFFAIDGSQAIPHFQVNVSLLWCQAYFFTWHKMMGPTGIGVLRLDRLIARSLQTTMWWWGIVETVTQDSCSLIRTADKFEPGTPNLIGAIGLGASIDFYRDHNIYTHISNHHHTLYSLFYSKAQSLNKIRMLPRWDDNHVGIMGFTCDDMDGYVDYLADHDVCVRVGGHCAHPLLAFGWYTHWLVRISPFCYNTTQQIEKVIDLTQRYFWL